MVLSPVEQLKRHFQGDRDFTSNFVKFVGSTIGKFNDAYYDKPAVQFVITSLLYNVETSEYSTKLYAPEKPGKVAREAASELADSMIGITHPVYCVGYVVSADGAVSKYDVDGEDAEEQQRIMEQLSGVEDPLAKEMIIHTVVSITGVHRMSLYEIVRSEHEIKNSGIRDNDTTLKSGLVELFSKADEIFVDAYNELSDIEKKSVRTNIFE
jgi:hypothetical protein